MASSRTSEPCKELFSLDNVRDTLIRLEDSIVFALIERARFPCNANAYDSSYLSNSGGLSIAEIFVKEAEALHSKCGRYQNPEEVPFFPDGLPSSILPPYNFLQILHPPSAPVTVNKAIWDMYLNDLLPRFTSDGDDGNYAATVAADLVCLQALSRRIHYGKFVAEVKFRESPQDYSPLIRAQDRDALMELLTFKRVEEMVKKRVQKKAMLLGQNITLEHAGIQVDVDIDEGKCKVAPSLVSRLYDEWVMPLTKLVEVEYLLLRLD